MSESGRTALLVVNASSHGGRDAKRYAAALEAGGMTLVRRDSTRAKMNDLILSMKNDVDCVILGGGDSTISAGAIALRDTGLPLGILPLGEGNELAQRLGIPEDPAGAAAVILGGQTRLLDLGSVNGRPFFNVATVGLSVQAARRLEQAAHGRLGRLSYMWTAARVAFAATRFSAIIRCGSVVHRVRTMQITVGNGSYYKAGMPQRGAGMPQRGANGPHDSFLGVYSLEPATKWRLLFLSAAFTAGETDEVPDTRVARSPVVEVVTRLPQPISADGEVVTVTPARFSILPRAVTVFVPAETTTAAAEPT